MIQNFKKIIAVVLVSLSTISLSFATTSIPNVAKIYLPLTRSSINHVLFPSQFKQYALGTAWFINSEGYMATAGHVIDGATHVWVMYKGQRVSAKVIAANFDEDIAILKVNLGATNAYFNLGEAKNKETDAILGYPAPTVFGTDLHITFGVVSSNTFDLNKFEMQGRACHGNSGGPIVNANSTAVGMLVEGFTDESTDNGLCSNHVGGLFLYNLINMANQYNVTVHTAFDVPTSSKISNTDLQRIQNNDEVVMVIAELMS